MEPIAPRSTKGKEKALDAVDPSPSAASTKQKSMASRILSSATALAKDVSAPRGISSDLASLASSSTKAMPSGSTSTEHYSMAESSRSGDIAAPERGQLHKIVESGPFRTDPGEFSSSEELRKFLDNNPEFANLQDVHDANGQHPWAAEFARNGSDLQELGRSSSQAQVHVSEEELHEDCNDGEAVRQLLSDPSFVAVTDDYDVDDPTAMSATALFSGTYTEEERHAIEKIRSELPSAPVHHPLPMDGPMNLLPDFDLPSHNELEGNPLDIDILPSTEQREQLLNEWSSVLSSYTDEVWGDLLPVVRELQEELEQVKTSGGILDAKAIARLKMVLGHVQGVSEVNGEGK